MSSLKSQTSVVAYKRGKSACIGIVGDHKCNLKCISQLWQGVVCTHVFYILSIKFGQDFAIEPFDLPFLKKRIKSRYLIYMAVFYSGLTKTSTALPRLSSKRTIL
ncbi:hypothetical protein A6J50_14060 [Neisseria meningitidis]|nr:hypothetical protein A6J54_13830 [Neisseria meningitidis]AVH83300.1 hypothetical protein A6J50_14060 [Neisseria meningitidis]